MQSLNIVFPEKGKVELVSENVLKLQPGEVLCAALKSLISTGTEMACLKGEMDTDTNWYSWVKYPFNPGYSMVAKVIQVGEDVHDIKVGDIVATETAHKQYFSISQNQAFVIPHTTSIEEATWFALSRVAQLGVRRAELKLGETVGIVGMGMVGQLVSQYLLLMGCRKIFCIDPVEERLNFVEQHPAIQRLCMDAEPARTKIKELNDGKMLDVVFDVTGHPAVLSLASQLVRKLGRVILLGDSPNPSQQHLGPSIVSDSISILGIHGSMFPSHATEFNPWTKDEMNSLFFEYLAQRRMNTRKLISHYFSPMDAPEVYEQLLKNRNSFMGVIFDWEEMN